MTIRFLVIKILTLAAAIVALVVPGIASAHQGGVSSPPHPSGFKGLKQELGDGCRSLFVITSANGAKKGCTHGPDPAPPGATPPARTRSVSELRMLTPTATLDSGPACEGNGTSGNRVQAVYAYPADRPDRSASVVPLVRSWAGAMDDVYFESARETAGSRRIRMVTEPAPSGACRVNVVTLPLTATGDDSFGNTIAEARAAGLTSSARRFVIWMDSTAASGASICGIGQMFPDDRAGQDNPNNGGVVTGEGGLVSRIDQQCWGSATHSVEAHELGHNLGAVQASAPNTSGGGHCVDEWDIMCYSDSPNFPVMTFLCGTQMGDSSHDNRLDCNHDDYFHTSPAAGSYLATHWNVARNNFLREAGLEHDATTVTATGDGDTVVEPGESVSFTERVRNRAAATATGIAGTISSPSGDVTPGSGAKSYPNAAPDATTTNASAYTATLAAATPCGAIVPITVHLTSDQGTHDVAAPLRSGSPGPPSTTSTSPAAPIPDNNASGVSVPLTVTGTGLVADVDVTVDIAHTWVEDLDATLTGPGGTTVELFSDVGGSGDNFTGTVLDDEAATAITAATAPFTGAHRPESALSALDGEPIAGTWTLNVSDDTAQDTGTVSGWGVTRRDAVCATSGSAEISGPTLAFTAAGGAANAITVSQSGSTYTISDTGSPVQPGPGCTPVTSGEVTCTSAAVTAVSVSTGDGNDTVTSTGSRAMRIDGGSGNDTLTGGSGADTIDGGSAGDVIAGGAGVDTATYVTRTAAVTVDIDGVKDDGSSSDGATATNRDNVMTDVENLTGGSASDTLTGSTISNTIDGGPGGDTIGGAGGSDTATYATRTAAVTVDIDGVKDDGSSTDGATATNRDNVKTDVENLTGGSASDTLTGSAVANRIDGGRGGDIIAGLGGADTVTYAFRTAAVTVDNDGVRDDGGVEDGATVASRDNVKTDVENLTGGAGADTLRAVLADAVVNVLTGGAGDDKLKTREGATAIDKLLCGLGTDQYDRDPSDTVSLCETSAVLP